MSTVDRESSPRCYGWPLCVAAAAAVGRHRIGACRRTRGVSQGWEVKIEAITNDAARGPTPEYAHAKKKEA